jgi:hypothetical protein
MQFFHMSIGIWFLLKSLIEITEITKLQKELSEAKGHPFAPFTIKADWNSQDQLEGKKP